MSWLFYFFFAWGVGYLINFLIFEKVKKGKKIFKRFGGAGIILSFLIVFFFSEVIITEKILALIIGSGIILILGVVDDLKNLNWKIQLGFQLALALLIIAFGFQVDSVSILDGVIWRLDGCNIGFLNSNFYFFGSIFLIIWVILIINAVNWSDGVDGLVASIGITASSAILFVSLRPEVNQPAVAIMAIIFIGSLLGFGWFNFPPAKIIAGTSGSYFIGFFLACLAVMAGTKIATLMIVLALPVLDAGWVIYDRFKSGQSIFSRDTEDRHLHYRLKKLGWSSGQILTGYFLFLFSMFLLSVFLNGKNFKIGILIFEVVLIFFVLIWVNKKNKRR